MAKSLFKHKMVAGSMEAAIGAVGALGINYLSSKMPATWLTGNGVYLTKAGLALAVMFAAPHVGRGETAKIVEDAGVGALTVVFADYLRAQALAAGNPSFAGLGVIMNSPRLPMNATVRGARGNANANVVSLSGLAGRMGVILPPGMRPQPQGQNQIMRGARFK